MPRLPRYEIIEENYPVHKVWRGHNKEWNLKTPNEKREYLRLLFETHQKDKENPLVAFTLMSNHTHEIFALTDCKASSNQMRRHHGIYGRFFNKKHQRSGKVAEDRPFTCLLGDDVAHMKAVFYVHANPVRAKMRKDARDYEWSTHNLYAFGKRPTWLGNFQFPDWYLKLGESMQVRQRRYRKLFAAYLKYEDGSMNNLFYQVFYGDPVWMFERMERLKKALKLRQSKAPPSE